MLDTHTAPGSDMLTAQDRATIASHAAELDFDGAFPEADIVLLARRGILKLVIPARFGGKGFGVDAIDQSSLAALLMDIGEASLSVGRLFEGHVNAAKLVYRFAKADLQHRVTRDIEDGHLLAIWNTSLAGKPLTLRADGDAYRLDGSKGFASGVGHVCRAVTSASQDGRGDRLVYAAFESASTPFSHKGWELQGMRATATGKIDLSAVRVGAEQIFGESQDYTSEPDFSGGAWRTLAVQAGGLRAILALTRQHLLHTAQSDADIQQLRLADMAIACGTAQLWVERCAERVDRTELGPDAVVALVQSARGAVADAARRVMDLAKQSIGARAFLRSNEAERPLRDLDFYLRQPAPDQAKRDVANYHLAHEDGAVPVGLSRSGYRS